jgi:phytoene dehydrogenase-like protein
MPDVVVVGSGPNGLAAAVTMARAGLQVHVYEAAGTPGGGLRTSELMQPGHLHDICSAVQPMALASPFFRAFELSRRVDLITPELSFGSPLDGGRAALAYHSLDRTVAGLGRDGPAYRRLMAPLVRRANGIADFTLNQLLRIPHDPIAAVLFGLRTLEQGSPAWGARFREELAPAIDAEPPTGMGQPCAWASVPSISPAPEGARDGNRPTECAATPVRSAGARSSRNLAPQAGDPCSSVRSPKRIAATGSWGTRRS